MTNQDEREQTFGQSIIGRLQNFIRGAGDGVRHRMSRVVTCQKCGGTGDHGECGACDGHGMIRRTRARDE